MKIQKIKWRNHPILGGLELDFTNSATGEPFGTVLFAGENGTGKTTILESISTFLNLGTFKFFDFIEYIVDGKVYRAVPQQLADTLENFFAIIDDTGNKTPIYSNRHNQPQSIDDNRLDIRVAICC